MVVEFLGNIHIDDNQLKNGLYGLEDLAHVDGNFILEMNNGLRNLTGLDGLIAIGGDFELTNHNVNCLCCFTD